MRAIQLHFSGGGASLDFNNHIDGFTSTVQNALVFVGQKKGTDKIYPDKGTTLHNNAVSGGLVSPETLEVALNELSVEAQLFINETEEYDYNDDTLASVDIELAAWEGDKARLNVLATSSKGETVGVSSIT